MKTNLGFALAVAVAASGCAGQLQGDPAPVGGDDGGAGAVGVFVTDPLCAAMGSSVGGSTGTGFATGTAGAEGPVPVFPGAPGVSEFPPNLGTTYSQPVAPPAISGGTLLVLANGTTAVAADPDRDSVYVTDLPSRTLKFAIALTAGDEPGRVIEDAAGRVHVALRHGGALFTFNPTTGATIARRAVCPAPRGLAYDPATDLVHVACHDGELVSLPASGGAAVRTLHLDSDLRDLVVSGSNLLVSRFRTAELLTVAPDGTVSNRVQLPAFSSSDARSGQIFTASVAWRTLPMPGGGVAMLHQRGLVDPVQPVAGGYGGLNPCDTIVHPAITTVASDGTVRSGPALAGLVLAVDMAIAPDGQRLAVVSAGNSTNTFSGDTSGTPALSQVFVSDVSSTTDSTIGCKPDGTHGPCSPGLIGGGSVGVSTPPILIGSDTGTGGTSAGGDSPDAGAVNATSGPIPVGIMGAAGAPGTGMTGDAGTGSGGSDLMVSTGIAGDTGTGAAGGFATGTAGFGGCGFPDPTVPQVVGQPIAVAFDGAGNIVVQSRQPAMLAFADGNNVTLSTVNRADTGHTLFHANSGGFLACGSCHAEGNEDGRTWSFNCEGTRRTQSLQTGLRGTEPFHWGGDEANFPQLMNDVFVGRMSGPTVTSDQGDALLSWLDAQPRAPKPVPADPAAVARGGALFADPVHACATCHTGAHFTNNMTVDVGTGGAFQVPSLIGVGSREPYMHNGCAATLTDRFDPSCGGGDRHGITSNLTTAQIADLVAYLNTI